MFVLYPLPNPIEGGKRYNIFLFLHFSFFVTLIFVCYCFWCLLFSIGKQPAVLNRSSQVFVLFCFIQSSFIYLFFLHTLKAYIYHVSCLLFTTTKVKEALPLYSPRLRCTVVDQFLFVEKERERESLLGFMFPLIRKKETSGRAYFYLR